MNKVLLPLSVCVTLAACGGVADNLATHRLAVQVFRHGKPLADQSLTASIRTYSDDPFGPSSFAVTNPQGRADFEFKCMWGAAFMVIPPLGCVPPRAPKPDYLLSLRGAKYVVRPKTSDTTYRWRDGGWHTEASLTVP